MKHLLQIINGCLTIFPLGMICTNICPGLAQSIIPTRNATGTLVTPVGNKYNINGGTLAGDRTNLFHSFDQFGLSAGETFCCQSAKNYAKDYESIRHELS